MIKTLSKMHKFDYFFLILFLTFKRLNTGSLSWPNYWVLFLIKVFLIKVFFIKVCLIKQHRVYHRPASNFHRLLKLSIFIIIYKNKLVIVSDKQNCGLDIDTANYHWSCASSAQLYLHTLKLVFIASLHPKLCYEIGMWSKNIRNLSFYN